MEKIQSLETLDPPIKTIRDLDSSGSRAVLLAPDLGHLNSKKGAPAFLLALQATLARLQFLIRGSLNGGSKL